MSGDQVLKGTLGEFKLGALQLRQVPCDVRASFETLRRRIRITGGDGVWPDNLGVNKRALIHILIKRWLAETDPLLEPSGGSLWINRGR